MPAAAIDVPDRFGVMEERERLKLMSRKSKESTHDAVLIEQKLNY